MGVYGPGFGVDCSRLLSGSICGCATSMPIRATRPVNLNESNNKKGNTYKSFQLAGKIFFVRETIVCSLLAAYVGC